MRGEVLRKDLSVVDFRPKSQYLVWKLEKVCPTFSSCNLYPSLQSVTTGDGKQSKARFVRRVLFLHSTAWIFHTQHLVYLRPCPAAGHLDTAFNISPADGKYPSGNYFSNQQYFKKS